MTEPINTAKDNAKAWYESIAAMVAALNVDYDRLEELREDRACIAADWDTENDQQEKARIFDRLKAWDESDGDELAELESAVEWETGNPCLSTDEARERIEQSVLSIEVRSDWQLLNEPLVQAEFRICLTTGGPALQIRGELDENSEPRRAWLEYQDWGTPWTQYFDASQDTLLAFCRVFYFGE